MTPAISTKFIELNTFLKLMRIAGTGGEAKVIIRSGRVSVNGEVETRNKRKLHASDSVAVDGKAFIVEESLIR